MERLKKMGEMGEKKLDVKGREVVKIKRAWVGEREREAATSREGAG